MIVYIDKKHKCHAKETDDTIMAVETPQFDGMCPAYIEGFRFTPAGSADGYGSLTPWKPYDQLVAAQTQYEADHAQMEDMENALQILLGGDST